MPSAPDAILLCGGAGTRLRNIIGGAAKSLANIGGRPFIHLLLHQFAATWLSTGYCRGWLPPRIDSLAHGRSSLRAGG
jgi:hypothetical protein